MTTRSKTIRVEAGTDNVYSDLGYSDPDAMRRKSRLAEQIACAIRMRELTQIEAAALLGVHQSKVSRITRGQFRGVSESRLLDFLVRLGRDVQIVVGPARSRTGRIELRFD
jgi:predicted XRE-type DNA-binding protein